MLAALDGPDFARLDRREAPEAALDDIARVHPRRFVQAMLDAVPTQGHVGIDADTILSPASGRAALHAAGAVVAAVDAVVAGEADNAFCAVRPPGHHAEPGRAMGFCLFNNAAIGALRARETHGLGRVAVVDFDVHHGNGTQALLLRRPEPVLRLDASIPALSRHRRQRTRPGSATSSTCRCAPMAGSREFRNAFSREILPALDAFRPELVLISAGFDAHKSDPLAQLLLDEADYTWVTERLLEVAGDHAKGRVVSTLEGGYDMAALGASAAAHLRVLMSAG